MTRGAFGQELPDYAYAFRPDYSKWIRDAYEQEQIRFDSSMAKFCGVVAIEPRFKITRGELIVSSDEELEQKVRWMEGAPNVWRHDPFHGDWIEFKIKVPDISSLP